MKIFNLVSILKKKGLSKSLFFRLHAWTGIIFGPMLYVICLGGSFAVISNEIDWLFNPNIKSQSGDMNWDLVYKKFYESYSDYELTTMKSPRHKGFAVHSYARSKIDKKTYRVFSNPVSGEVQSIESFWNVQRFFRSFHRRFFITFQNSGRPGILFVSLYGIPLLIVIILGVRVQGKKILKLVYNLRGNRNNKKLFSNSHLLLSNWSWVFALIIALTGIWYAIEIFKPPPSIKTKINPTFSYDNHSDYGGINDKINYLTNVSSSLINGFKPDTVRLDKKNDLIQIHGKTDGLGVFLRSRANIIAFDYGTGNLRSIYRTVDTNSHKIISDIADPIHFGVWGGLYTQVIWFTLGLILSFAVMAGLMLAAKRIPVRYHPSKLAFNCSVLLLFLVLFYSLYGGYEEYSRYAETDPKLYIKFVIFTFSAFLVFSLCILIKLFRLALYKNNKRLS